MSKTLIITGTSRGIGNSIVHLADIVAGIGYVFNNEHSIFRENLLINSNTISLARKLNIKKFIYVGTACSYPKHLQNGLNSIMREDMLFPAIPESSYGWSKLMGEYEAELAYNSGLIDIEILRLHNVYGSPAELDPSKSQVIPALCRKAIEQKNEQLVFLCFTLCVLGFPMVFLGVPKTLVNGVSKTLVKGVPKTMV